MDDRYSEPYHHYNIHLDNDYLDNLEETYCMAPIGIFNRRYASSKSYIADLTYIGPILISIKAHDDFTYALVRSSLGFVEYRFSNFFLRENHEIHAFMLALYRYFSDTVQEWDIACKTRKKKTYFDFFGLFNFKKRYPLSADTNSSSESKNFLEYISIQVLSHLEEIDISNIVKDFAEINFFYAEEVDNFFLRKGLNVKIENEIYEKLFPRSENSKYIESSYDNCIESPLLDYKVTAEEYKSTEICQKSHDKGLLVSIEEFIVTEIDYFISIHSFHIECQKIRNNHECITDQIYNEIFKNYDKVHSFVRIFVKDLLKRFKFFTLPQETKYKELFKGLDEIDNTKQEDNHEDSENIFQNEDLIEEFVSCLYENSFGFVDYSNFLLSYEISLEKINIFSQKYETIFNKAFVSEAFGHVSQRLFRYSLLFKSILNYGDLETKGYKDLKVLYIRMNNFLKCIDKRKEEQDNHLLKIRISNVLKIDILDNNEEYVDYLDCVDAYGDEFTLLLFSNSIIISKRSGPPSSIMKSNCKYKYLETLSSKDVEIHTRGEKGIYIISNIKKDLNYYYEEEYKNCSIFVLYYVTYSENSRKRFVYNFNRVGSLFSYKNIRILENRGDVNLTCDRKNKNDLEITDEQEVFVVKKEDLVIKTTKKEKECLCKILEFMYFVGSAYINKAIIAFHLFGDKNRPFIDEEMKCSDLEKDKSCNIAYVNLNTSFSTRETFSDIFKIYNEEVYLRYKFILGEIMRANENLERMKNETFYVFEDFLKNRVKTMENLLENIVSGKDYSGYYFEIFETNSSSLEADTPKILDFILKNIYCYFLHDDLEVLYKLIFVYKKIENLKVISRTKIFKNLLEYFKIIKNTEAIKDFLKIFFHIFLVSDDEIEDFLERLKSFK